MMEQVANAILAELGSRVRAWRARHSIKGRLDEAKFADHIELVAFRRSVGGWVGVHTDPHGTPISTAEFDAKKDQWLPTDADKMFIHSFMHRVTEPGKMAGWIAAPDCGINANPVEYQYVKL